MRTLKLLCSAGIIGGSVLLAAAARARTTSITIKASFVSETDGPCSLVSTDYNSYCPSNNCVCDTYSGTISGALAGKGSATVAITVDEGAATPLAGSGCFPYFAVATFSTSRESETDNSNGSICTKFSSSDKLSVTGGFGIGASALGESGWGTVSGTLNESVSPATLTLRLKAKISP